MSDDFQNSVWAKRIAREERWKEIWGRVVDAFGVLALFTMLLAPFFLKEGFGW